MKTTIDNNQRVFLLQATGWSSAHFFCNMADIVTCAGQFEKNQPYTISHFWNGQPKKLTTKKVIELLEANQLDASFFKKAKYLQPS